jgi:hypothetical protein
MALAPLTEAASSRNRRSAHVPDRRPGTIPVEDHRADRQKASNMAAKRRRPCWDNVERVVRLLISIADEVARVTDAFRRIR